MGEDIIYTETAFFFHLNCYGFIEDSEMSSLLSKIMYESKARNNLYFICYIAGFFANYCIFATPEAIIKPVNVYKGVKLFDAVMNNIHIGPNFLYYVEHMTDAERKNRFTSAIESLGCDYFKNPKLYRNTKPYYCWDKWT